VTRRLAATGGGVSGPRGAPPAAPRTGGGGLRLRFGVRAELVLSDQDPYALELAFEYGAGPAVVVFGPRADQKPRLLGEMVEQIAEMLGIKAIGAVASLGPSSSSPWKHIFKVGIAPHLTVELAEEPAVQLIIDLYEEGKQEPGVALPGDRMPSWLKIEPDFTVYSLIVGYDKRAGGLDLRARVKFEEQKKAAGSRLWLPAGGPHGPGRALGTGERPPSENPDRPGSALGTGEPPAEESAKTEIVSFPFPSPPPSTPNLEVKYLGLGQRFGPDVDVNAADPLAEMFTKLEALFTSNDPRKLLDTLAGYYRPDRGWFVAAHVLVREWELRAVFNDPALYGMEITCDTGTYKGLLLEILYQKLAEGLGVYYGALTLPTRYRKIQAGPVTLIVPSFRLWIYTNGDFKVCVGWPLGPGSIGVQVIVFTGGAGFYFAKLRSGDRPDSGPKALRERGSSAAVGVPAYNPILEFGLGMWVGLGRSIESGPFTASLTLTLQGTFQGVLAWEAPPQPLGPSWPAVSGHSVSGPATPRPSVTGPTPLVPTAGGPAAAGLSGEPDYHWFAATVTLIGEVQGTVDLKIVKLSVFVRLTLSAGLAFETDYASALSFTATIEVEASLKIAFFTISVSFHATISHTFELGAGKLPYASVKGPHNPAFAGMNEWSASGLDALESSMTERRRATELAEGSRATREPYGPYHGVHKGPLRELPPAPATPSEVELGFLLNPSAVYESGRGRVCGVAVLTIGCPPDEGGEEGEDETELEKLADAVASWLLRTYSAGGGWPGVAATLGQGRDPEPGGWGEALEGFLAREVSFTINPAELRPKTDEAQVQVALFPMFEDLQLTYTGGAYPVVFANTSRTHANYVGVLERYFDELSLSSLTSNPPTSRAAPAGEAQAEPTGPSLAHYVFEDWFLTFARQLAREMSEKEASKRAARAVAANVGGFVSRYLLNGLRLPDPATTPAKDPIELAALTIDSGYALSGQQFELVEPTPPVCEGTLRIRPSPGPVAAAIRFPDGAHSVTSSMSVEPLPPAPAPAITIEAIPPAHARDRWVAARTRLPWHRPDGATPFLVPLPPEVLGAAREQPLQLTVRQKPPCTGDAEPLTVEPVLLIPLTVHLVDRARNEDVTVEPAPLGEEDGEPSKGAPSSPYAPFVYRVEGTDDETRTRIEAALEALDGGRFGPDVSIALLHDARAPASGYDSDLLDPQRHPVVLAKVNLSTTSEPGGVTTPLRLVERALADELGPTSAKPEDVADFLRIVWELSVVRTGGFFLRYQTADGRGLPDWIFSPPDQPPVGGLPGGEAANVTLAVSFSRESSFRRWHNAFSVALSPKYDGTLYVGLANADGPLQDLNPCYPPGCVAFAGERADEKLLHEEAVELYGKEWVAHMYHLIQFRVNGAGEGSQPAFGRSLWSLALGPSQGDGEGVGSRGRAGAGGASGNGEGASGEAAPPAPPQTYRQVVPVFRFVEGAGESPNPYGAVGGEPTLRMLLNDVYGNALDSGAHDVAFEVLYNDPLWTPAEWPGVRVAYRLLPGPPTMALNAQFEPDEVIRTGAAAAAMVVQGVAPGEATDADRAAQQAQVALQRYASVAAQLEDEQTTVSLTASVLPGFDAGGQLKGQLACFARAIAAELRKVIDGGDPQPRALKFAAPIDPGALAQVEADVAPVEVAIGLSRPPDLVYTDPAGRRVPKSDAASTTVAADTDPPAGGTARARARAEATGGSPPVDVGLAQFAADFEAVFAGFDRAGGGARLSARADTPDLSVPTGTPSLWAIRFSASRGIDVRFAAQGAAYFSPAPLAVNLEGGEAAVPTYDAQLVPRYASRTFEGVDMEAWGRTFAEAVDRVLSPESATVIAAADPDTYANLMRAKQVLARAMAAGVEPVYEPAPNVLPGDLATAREHFEQAALGSLAAAYSIASVVQAPATIAVSDGTGPPALAPRLFGAVQVRGGKTGGGTDTGADARAGADADTNAGADTNANAGAPVKAQPGVSVSSAKLALVAAPPERPAYLTFFVSVADGSQAARVELDLQWRVRFAEHMAADARAEYGYEPSEWLRMARELPEDPLSFGLGELAVPIPARRYPAAPILEEQTAHQSPPGRRATDDPLSGRLQWDYAVALTLPQVAAQDALWVDVTYNLPVTGPPRGAAEEQQPTLFQALASFDVAWPVLEPHVARLADGDATPGPAAVAAAVWEQVQRVASAWARLRGIRDPWGANGVDATAAPADVPEVVVDSYVMDFQDAYRPQQRLHVYARAPLKEGGGCDEDAVRWPSINGHAPIESGPVCNPPHSTCAQAPTEEPCWWRAEYELTPHPTPEQPYALRLEWTGGDVLQRQTARTACWVTRNARLAGTEGTPTNPKFVYRTPEVAFANAVAPSIVVAPIGPLPPQETLAQTLEWALAAIGRAGSAASKVRLVKVALTYGFELGAGASAGRGVRSHTAILLADQLELRPSAGTGPAAGGVTLTELCEALDADCGVWFEYYAPVRTGASVTVALTLFADVAGSRMPVLQLEAMELTVSAKWWRQAARR
jgi:hypothetical protein